MGGVSEGGDDGDSESICPAEDDLFLYIDVAGETFGELVLDECQKDLRPKYTGQLGCATSERKIRSERISYAVSNMVMDIKGGYAGRLDSLPPL